MNRLAIGLQYQGSAYHGWQQQVNIKNIQAEVENAISKVANCKIAICCAGRTDKGVHALNQVIHFDTPHLRQESAWILGVNRYLPNDISVQWVQSVDTNFHARFSAISRTYCYVIFNQARRNAILNSLVTPYYKKLDALSMHEAGQYLIGEHDFSSFRGPHCQSKTPMRSLSKLSVERKGDYIYIVVKANAFLQHMVRNIVGVLMKIGEGTKPISWIDAVLKARDRQQAATTAAPNGLFLVDVEYKPPYQFPKVDLFREIPL